jgi:hypothetical protein
LMWSPMTAKGWRCTVLNHEGSSEFITN